MSTLLLNTVISAASNILGPNDPPMKDLSSPASATATSTPVYTEKVTADVCLNNFKQFIKSEKPGLNIFYSDEKVLAERAEVAANMVNHLNEIGCTKEMSKQLSILCLYDIVMLIDDSSSMYDDEGGSRIRTLKATMDEITKIYDKANSKGLLSVKFINAGKGYKNIDHRRVGHVMKDRSFWGTTQIGHALQKKVIDNFIFNTNIKMTKPLLVMTITDGEPEGESPGHLKGVINKCIEKLKEDKDRGVDAVAFHFSRVGNDQGAEKLLNDLDDTWPSVDCLSADYALEGVQDEGFKWFILSKLLLGAIVANLNDADEEGKLGEEEKIAPQGKDEDDEDEEIELED